MPLFFFDVDDGKVNLDHYGVELASVADAQKEATRIVSEMTRDRIMPFDGSSWSLLVRNGSGIIVASITVRANAASECAGEARKLET